MDSFTMNGYHWFVRFVDDNDPVLVDRTGRLTVATTDPNTRTVCLSNNLHGDFLIKVLLHELGHCALFSFDLTEQLHRMVRPEYWIEAEEWACNLIADYGFKIFSSVFSVLGYNAWELIPAELDQLVA